MTTFSADRFVRVNEGASHVLAGPYAPEVAERIAEELKASGYDAEVDD